MEREGEREERDRERDREKRRKKREITKIQLFFLTPQNTIFFN